MISKSIEKEKAILLRKNGFSYNEILKEISVSKSTLSLWLRNIGIAKKQQQKLTEKRKLAQIKAQQSCKEKRIFKEQKIISEAKLEIKKINLRELFLIGVTLYWAEGAKQKDHNVSQGVSFGNSDPKMILLFKRWLNECCKIEDNRICYRIYIHEKADILRAKEFWSNLLDSNISKFHLKKHNPKTVRKNTLNEYYGLLRMDISRSTDLNRKIKGWIHGIIENSINIAR